MTGPLNISLEEQLLRDLHNMRLSGHALPAFWPTWFKALTDEEIENVDQDVTHLLQSAKRRRRQRRTQDTDIILETLRKMAWAKAKAELEGILETYWSMDGEFEEIETEIWSFIERMEDRL